MKYKIIWSPKSKENFSLLLQFVESEFGLDAALDVLEKTERIIEAITLFPKMFPSSNKFPGVRMAKITKQTSLIYKVSESEIKLLEFWDNRQNPK